jgi:hypothetical protein
MFSEGKDVKSSENIDKHESNQFADIWFQIRTWSANPGLGPTRSVIERWWSPAPEVKKIQKMSAGDSSGIESTHDY